MVPNSYRNSIASHWQTPPQWEVGRSRSPRRWKSEEVEEANQQCTKPSCKCFVRRIHGACRITKRAEKGPITTLASPPPSPSTAFPSPPPPLPALPNSLRTTPPCSHSSTSLNQTLLLFPFLFPILNPTLFLPYLTSIHFHNPLLALIQHHLPVSLVINWIIMSF